jgi:hypothetical protein
LEASAAQLREAATLPHIPLIVIDFAYLHTWRGGLFRNCADAFRISRLEVAEAKTKGKGRDEQSAEKTGVEESE